MFIHIDIDYFFAQAEKLRHPELKKEVIIVCVFSGRTKDSGVVSTVNYEGRKYGIHSGMPIFQAKKRAPQDSIFLSVDHGYYEGLSSKINDHMKSDFKNSIQTSIDEWFIESDDDKISGIAKRLKNWILSDVGLTCSIGIAPSMLGAKMAAGKSKPDGFLYLDEESERRFVNGSDIENIIGIGEKTSEILQGMGISKVMDLKKMDKVALVERFGKKMGSMLVALAENRFNGVLAYGEGAQSEVSRICTLAELARDKDLVIGNILRLEKDNRIWLRENKKSFSTLSLIFVSAEMQTISKSVSFNKPRGPDEENAKDIIHLVDKLFLVTDREIRRVGIRFSRFSDSSGQKTLFE